MLDDRLRVGLLGCGIVGSQVARLLVEDPRLRARYRLVGVAVRDLHRARPSWLDPALVTDDVRCASADSGADVLIEVMGGLEPAGAAVESALGRGVPVVTANKTLIAERGPHLREVARRHATSLRYEAAVAAAVPVVDVLERLVKTDRVLRIEGALNGTCNFVLSEMERTGETLDQATEEARRRGYAEADPTRDLDGRDAADKVAVLAQVIWDRPARTEDVQRLGIEALTPEDIGRAAAAGRTWRLVATATEDGCLVVEPRPLRRDHALARLRGPENGIVITTAYAGTLTFTGPGAGGLATASAVIADVDAATRVSGVP